MLTPRLVAETSLATLQGYLLPSEPSRMGGYWLAGLWKSVVSRGWVISLSVVLTAIYLGQITNRRMPSGSFVIYIALIIVALIVILRHPVRKQLPGCLHKPLTQRY